MNLEESNEFVEKMEKNNKNKRTVIMLLVSCAVLIAILFITINYIKIQDSLKLKMYVNNQEVGISSTLLVQDGETQYMDIRGLANLLGYSYQKGEYKKYNEDETSCYLRNNYEIVSMVADSDIATKYIINEQSETENNTEDTSETESDGSFNIVVDSANETFETFSLTDSVKYINNRLYVPYSEIARLFNVQFDVSSPNRIKINTIDNLIPSVSQIAGKLKYTEISNIYENLTAIMDNMLVVGKGTGKDKVYGVISLEDGHEIISLKYQKIVYMQNTKEFLVTAEDSVGIIDSEGKTIIKPTSYDSISRLDEPNKLYLVQKDDKYGVLNGSGEVIVYPEYDSIGIPDEEEFKEEDIRNYNLLFDECIPVESNGKYGLIDIEGNERLKCVYDTLGYLANATIIANGSNNTSSQNTTSTAYASTEEYESLLTIPESVGIKGVIINLNGLYGIYDVEAKRIIIPCACTKIYPKVRAGVRKYYLEYNDQEIELEEYLEQQGLKSIGNNSNSQVEQEDNINQEDDYEETENEE